MLEMNQDSTELLISDLRSKGMRVTPQRELIMRIFQEEVKDRHLSAEDVYDILVKKGESISLATTYRTLRMLVEMGFLRELDFAESHKHYELINPNESPHHHIICMNCNKTIEFEDDEINELGKAIAKKHGVEIVDMQFQIFANCKHEDGDDDGRKHRQ